MDVYIKKITLKNFQSWENCTINLEPGFNVIRSDDNSAGKSVIMKAIKMTICPNIYSKKEIKKMIRFGAAFAEAIFIFSDNTIGVTRVFENKLMYIYNSGAGWQQQEGHPMEIIVAKMGGLVDYNANFIANLLDMDQPLLLVNSNNNTNYSLVEMITHHEDLSRLTPLFREKTKEHRNKSEKLHFANRFMEKQLEDLEYVDVAKLEKNIEVADDIMIYINQLIESYKVLENSSKLTVDYKDYNYIDDILYVNEQLAYIFNLEFPEVNEVNEDSNSILDFIGTCVTLMDLLNVPLENEIDDTVLDAIDMCEICESLTSLISIELHDADTLNVISNVLDIYEEIKILKDDMRADISNSRGELINAHTLLSSMNKQFIDIKKADIEIAEIDYKLKERGAGANCPVYGDIIIKNNKCYNLQV